MMSEKVASKDNEKVVQNTEKTKISSDRDKKIMNSIANVSILMVSIMMGAFSELMVNMTGEVASGMASVLSGEDAGTKVKEEIEQKIPEVDEKMKAMISDIRKDIYAQFGQKRQELEPLLSDSAFDVGPQIIEKYDFNLPKLTEELDDASLAKYTKLMVNEDHKFEEMYKGLTEWMNTLPKLPPSNDAQ